MDNISETEPITNNGENDASAKKSSNCDEDLEISVREIGSEVHPILVDSTDINSEASGEYVGNVGEIPGVSEANDVPPVDRASWSVSGDAVDCQENSPEHFEFETNPEDVAHVDLDEGVEHDPSIECGIDEVEDEPHETSEEANDFHAEFKGHDNPSNYERDSTVVEMVGSAESEIGVSPIDGALEDSKEGTLSQEELRQGNFGQDSLDAEMLPQEETNSEHLQAEESEEVAMASEGHNDLSNNENDAEVMEVLETAEQSLPSDKSDSGDISVEQFHQDVIEDDNDGELVAEAIDQDTSVEDNIVEDSLIAGFSDTQQAETGTLNICGPQNSENQIDDVFLLEEQSEVQIISSEEPNTESLLKHEFAASEIEMKANLSEDSEVTEVQEPQDESARSSEGEPEILIIPDDNQMMDDVDFDTMSPLQEVNNLSTSEFEESVTAENINSDTSPKAHIPLMIIEPGELQSNGYLEEKEGTDFGIKENGENIHIEELHESPSESVPFPGADSAVPESEVQVVADDQPMDKVFSYAREYTDDDDRISTKSTQELDENISESLRAVNICAAEEFQTALSTGGLFFEPEYPQHECVLLEDTDRDEVTRVITKEPTVGYPVWNSPIAEEPVIGLTESVEVHAAVPTEEKQPTDPESPTAHVNETVEEVVEDVDGAAAEEKAELDFSTRYALFVGKVLPGHEVFYLPQSDKNTSKKVRFPKGGTLDRHSRAVVTSNTSPMWDPAMHARSATLGAPRRHRTTHRLKPRPAVNDDHLFPDSVTPSKVEKTLSDAEHTNAKANANGGLYDVPFMDDDAFVPKKYRSTIRAKDRYDGVYESEEGGSWSSSSDTDYSMEARELLGTDHLAKMDELSSHSGLIAIDRKNHPENEGGGPRWLFGLSICGCLRRRR